MLSKRIGAYRVLRLLGEGGMGAVYEAVHESIARQVAIKVLHPDIARQPGLGERFLNEARVVNMINHPGIVQASDVGTLPDGRTYIVMELLKGETLSERIKRCGSRLPTSEAVYFSEQLADALASAHEKGIVHRDLKPSNIMIVSDPQARTGERTKLLDFGIAKLLQGRQPGQAETRTHAMLGTPAYMSPEQCAGAGRVDEKTDVYALGVVLYQLLSGSPPFDAEGSGIVMAMHLHEAPADLRAARPEVSDALAMLVHELLRKSAAERPTMRAVQRRLAQLADSLPVPNLRTIEVQSASIPALPVPPPLGRRIDPRSTLGSIALQSIQNRGKRSFAALLLSSALLFASGLGIGLWKSENAARNGSLPVDMTPRSAVSSEPLLPAPLRNTQSPAARNRRFGVDAASIPPLREAPAAPMPSRSVRTPVKPQTASKPVPKNAPAHYESLVPDD